MNAVSPLDPSFDFFNVPLGGIIRASHDAIVVIDEQQTIVAINPAAQRMFGCTATQALGTSLDRFIPAAARPEHAAHVREFSASGTHERVIAEHRHITAMRATGDEFPVQIALSRVDVALGGTTQTYFAALMRDLSVECQLTDALDLVKLRLCAVFELMPIAHWIADTDHVVFANRAAARLFGTDNSEWLIGKSVFSVLCPKSHAALRRQMTRANAGEVDFNVVRSALVRPDGRVREVEIALAALPEHGRTTVQMVVADVTHRRQESLELERSRRALRQLSASVVEAREAERRRIARELHDELGQRLTALKMDLSGLACANGLNSTDTNIASMLTMIDETVASVRRIASDLRPLMLDDLGLNAAIEWLASDASRRLGIVVQVQLGEDDMQVDERVAIALYRMVQEALTNVARHAKATKVEICLRQHDDTLELTVQDDGVGFPKRTLHREGSFGLLGMRERAHMLGGHLMLESPPGQGGRVIVRLPLTPPSEPATESRPMPFDDRDSP
jgi:two-component system, NarL family, sensor histidine kinase UhpB